MNAPLQRSLLLPISAAAAFTEIRENLRRVEAREQEAKAARQRQAIARKVALADLIEAHAE